MTREMMTSAVLTGTACVLVLSASAWAAWPSDPTVNVPVCTAQGGQGANGLASASDSAGGAIVAWTDTRGSSEDTYAQRVDAVGTVRWATDGVPICTASGNQRLPVVVGDGAGGAIIAWTDTRNGESDIYAQRVDATGVIQWPVGSPSTDGVAVVNTLGNQIYLGMVSDGAGGAILVWSNSDVTAYDLFGQRLDGDGEVQWPTGSPSLDGVAICTATGVQIFPRLDSDGFGGAVVAWEDGRNNPTTNYDIYAQRVGADGVPMWTADGVEVCRANVGQLYPAIARDGAGGAVIAWEDRRDSSDTGLYAQRVDSAGSAVWTTDGVLVSDTYLGGQHGVEVEGDGDSGAIVVWVDVRDYATTSLDLFAQRLAATGTELWTAGGVAVSAAAEKQEEHMAVSTPSGGVLISWTDRRNPTFDIYAQSLDSTGAAAGAPGGQAVSTADFDQAEPVLVGDGSGGAILAWRDYRNHATSGADVYAQAAFSSSVFADGFESADTSAWSATVP